MTRSSRWVLLAIVGVGACSGAVAADRSPTTDPPTFMVTRQTLTWSDPFDGTTSRPDYGSPGSQWSVQGGVLVGRHLQDHAPGLRKRGVNVERSVVQFDFRFQGADMIGIKFNHVVTRPSEHVGTVAFLLRQRKARLTKQSGGWGGPLPAVKQPEDEAAIDLVAGKWYRTVVEIVGQEIVVSVDGRPLLGGHLDLTMAVKDQFALTLTAPHEPDKQAHFDNLKIWDAVPDPSWPQRRRQLFP